MISSRIPTESLPTTLWKDAHLQFPPIVFAAYYEDLLALDLVDASKAYREHVIGGETEEQFNNHYASRFGVGTCRASAALLDPAQKFGPVPIDLQTTFAAGDVCLVDAPSGACPASLGFLGALAELRQAGVLATTPLDVTVFAADVSPSALNAAGRLFGRVESSLSAQGIEARLFTRIWDARKPKETAALADWVQEQQSPPGEFVIVCQGFSGTASSHDVAEADKNFPLFSPSLSQLVELLGPRRTTFLSIEPKSKEGNNFQNRLKSLIEAVTLRKVSGKRKHLYHWWNPILSQGHQCNITLMSYVRND